MPNDIDRNASAQRRTSKLLTAMGIFVGLGIIAYSLQLYFDFSGYSLMGIGMGKMLGFDFPTNFNYPYISASITEFWRRWHMTLSGWFREYVYIPLGGNRKGLKRQIFNLFVVELLTGIWHGANWNFICWGLYYFVLLAIEKLFYQHNQTTVIGVAEARGVILLAAAQAGLPIYEYTPMQVKQAVVGYGLAEKRQVMDMVKRLLKLRAGPIPAVFPAQLRRTAGCQRRLLHPAH